MTISTSTNKVSFAADGSTTTFVVSFYFLDNTHLIVYLKAPSGAVTTAVLNSDYTVSGAGNVAGGSITFTTAPATGFTVTIVRDVPATQETAYQENDPFPAKTHEQALDKLTMIAQQNIESIGRGIKLNVTDPAGTNVELPVAAVRANKALIFDETGGVTVSVGNFDDAGIYANNAAASATAAAASASSASSSLASFLNIYLGSFAADPTQTPTGGALTAGDLYWNTTSSSLRIYNGTSWQASATASPSSFTSNVFSGNGSTTNFTLSSAPASLASVLVFISGVAQRPTTDFTISGTTLIISPAPATGTNNILALVASTVAAGTPDNGSVSTVKIQDAAVTAAKMAAGAASGNLGFTPLRPSNNLSDVTSPSGARTNLGLGSAATLNAGTAANNVVQLDSSAKLPALDGSALINLPSGSSVNLQTFTASGTWAKPATGSVALIRAWGGGGGGGKGGGSASRGSGGGGGAFKEYFCRLSDLGSTATVTIGSGGAGPSVGGNGGDGGNSTFVSGSLTVTAYGGAGGQGNATTSGVGGGGSLSAGTVSAGGTPDGGGPAGGTASYWGGGGGGSANSTNQTGGLAIWGGGGGGGSGTTGGPWAGGTSLYGGAGGAGTNQSGVAGVNGTAPGGGGGGQGVNNTTDKAGNGGNGRVEVYVW